MELTISVSQSADSQVSSVQRIIARTTRGARGTASLRYLLSRSRPPFEPVTHSAGTWHVVPLAVLIVTYSNPTDTGTEMSHLTLEIEHK